MADPFEHAAAEVQRYFDAKGIVPSFDWRDLNFDEHAHSFTIAKSAGYDILDDVKASLSKAIQERIDYAEWAKGIEPTLKAKGWWGKAIAADPLTGEEKLVQLGSPARLKTIYWANVNTAYAAGEWERIQRTKRVMPYLQYLHTTAEHPRPQHLAWVGTILPVDSAWWSTHYPPNGWGCQCRVRQLADAEAERLGYNADDPAEPADFGSREFVNKRTGERSMVPVGIDPGWAQNPGALRAKDAADQLAGKIDAMSPNARAAATKDLAESWLMKRIASGTIPFDPHATDPGMVSRGQIAAPFAALPERIAVRAETRARAVQLTVKDATAIGAAPEDYGVLDALMREGEATIAADGAIELEGEVEGEIWRARIRPGFEATGLYLTEFGRARTSK